MLTLTTINDNPRPAQFMIIMNSLRPTGTGAMMAVGPFTSLEDLEAWVMKHQVDASFLIVVMADPRAREAQDFGKFPDELKK